MKFYSKEDNTEVDGLVVIGDDPKNKNLYLSIDKDIPEAKLCYATLFLLSYWLKTSFKIDPSNTEEVQRVMPYLEKMVIKFAPTLSDGIETTEAGEQAVDEAMQRLRERIPPAMLELLETPKKRENKSK